MCDQFLAGTTLAKDQNPPVCGSSHTDLLAQRLHRDAVADHLIAMPQLIAKSLIFFFEAPLLHRVAHSQNDFLERKRFFNEVECAELSRAHRRFDGAVSRDHNHRWWMRCG